MMKYSHDSSIFVSGLILLESATSAGGPSRFEEGCLSDGIILPTDWIRKSHVE